MKNLLVAEKISSGYKNFRLKNLSIQIASQSITGIIGPNGSGKTTLIKTLSRKVAMVSQVEEVPNLTVQDYVLLGRIPYYKKFQFFETGENIEIVHDVMTYTGIFDYKERFINELSGGERQLCHITRALAQKPEFLILDEPTNFLDISHQVEILDLLHRLCKMEKLTILMVMHDLNLASEYCDDLLLMSGGEIFTKGKPQEVLTYKNIEQVYKTTVVVKENPISTKPFVFIISNNEMKKHKERYHPSD